MLLAGSKAGASRAFNRSDQVRGAIGGGAGACTAPEYYRESEADSDGKVNPLGKEMQQRLKRFWASLKGQGRKTLVTLQLGTGEAEMRCTLPERQHVTF